ncbi:hypothetical protein ABZ438_07990 [Streptomyces sp. NPDC005786]|uniref:hypothetical protein n=1 Tax=Streptomyces sp. NPDC005786 TaxID=3154891 RepID=UPI0033F506D0
MQLPEQQPVRPGQPDPVMDQALQFAAAVEEAIAGKKQTSIRIDDPDVPSWEDGPRIGIMPAVPQPGTQPMSQWATDVSGVLKAVGVVAIPVGGAFWLVGQVDPMTLGIIGGTPVAAAVAIGWLVGKVKAVVESAPPVIHQHYHGPVTQDSRSITSKTAGVIANTRNQHPN